VEELYMHVTIMAAAFKFLKKNREPNVLRIKNMMLLLEPGPGIQDGYVWDPEYVQKAKNHLVDLLSQRLTVRKPNKSDALRSEFNEKMFKDLVWYFTVDVQCLRCHQRVTYGPRKSHSRVSVSELIFWRCVCVRRMPRRIRGSVFLWFSLAFRLESQVLCHGPWSVGQS